MDLLQSLQKDGYQIHAVAAKDKYVKKLTDQGFVFTPIRINNNGTNPLKDLFLVFQKGAYFVNSTIVLTAIDFS